MFPIIDAARASLAACLGSDAQASTRQNSELTSQLLRCSSTPSSTTSNRRELKPKNARRSGGRQSLAARYL
jgi:hypothetical protein